MSHSGTLAYTRWPQSSRPYAGCGTGPSRGTAASAGGQNETSGEPRARDATIVGSKD